MRKYLPTLGELIDRLSISQLKEVFIRDHKEEYSQEILDILHDIDEILKDNKINYIRYDIETQEGYDRLVSEAARVNYGGELGAIPTFIVGNKMIIGYDPIEVLYTLKRIETQQICLNNKKLYHKNFSMIDVTKIGD